MKMQFGSILFVFQAVFALQIILVEAGEPLFNGTCPAGLHIDSQLYPSTWVSQLNKSNRIPTTM